ncbi:MAG: hypothetical protein ACTSXX_04830 [Candidatus Baldrarchaeia archaeon]
MSEKEILYRSIKECILRNIAEVIKTRSEFTKSYSLSLVDGKVAIYNYRAFDTKFICEFDRSAVSSPSCNNMQPIKIDDKLVFDKDSCIIYVKVTVEKFDNAIEIEKEIPCWMKIFCRLASGEGKRAWAIAFSNFKKHKNVLENHPEYYFDVTLWIYKGLWPTIFAVRKSDIEELSNEIEQAFFKLNSPSEASSDEVHEEISEEEVDENVDVFAKFKGGVKPKFKDIEISEEGWKEYENKKKEMQERVEKQTLPGNLQRVKIVCFDLPSEYKGSKTKFDYVNRHATIKFDEKVDITKVRTLRRQFYRLLNQYAWRSMVGWILLRDADLSKLDDVIMRLNQEFEERRVIYLVEAFLPKETVIEWLEYYIAEVKTKAQELEEKMKEKEDDQKALRRIRSEWKKTLELIKRLYDEMKYLKSPSN